MHGSLGPTLILNLSPKSEEEIEQERLREIARSSHLSDDDDYDTDEEELVSIPMLLESSDGCGCRMPDDILQDHMSEVESQHFSKSRMPSFARAMGMSEDDIADLALQMGLGEGGEIRAPKSLSKFKDEYEEYRKYGGDPISVAMSREMATDEYDPYEMDDMLSVAMDSTSMMDMSDPMNQAMAALEEEFGRDAEAMMEGEADGYILFSVDCPRRGMKKYIYDTKAGVGTVMEA